MEGGMPIHHLVDGELNYKGFQDFLKTRDMDNLEYDYSLLAVFGGQSTGKSTLLNRLFKTSFEEMNSADRRGQTTQGVWMAKAAGSDNLIVLDFEGTDSQERGEEGSFEKKLSLFALALADVLLINVFQHEIGRRHAMNIPLLETILQLNFDIQMQVKSSGGGTKKMLMFVIRDYDGNTPVPILSQQLLTTMEDVWKKITKPPEHTDDSFQKWFDFSVNSLPHPQSATFEDDAVTLSKCFLDQDEPNYAFSSDSGKRSSGVHINQLDVYAKTCWTAIKDNKNINIPGEKELVAKHRMGEIIDAHIEAFTTESAAMNERAAAGDSVGLSGSLKTLAAATIKKIEQEVYQFSRYKEVMEVQLMNAKQDINKKISDIMQTVYDSLCKKLERNAKESLSVVANDLLRESQDFNQLWDRLRQQRDKVFSEVVVEELKKFVADGKLDDEGMGVCATRMGKMIDAALQDALQAKAVCAGELMSKRFLYCLLHNADGVELGIKEDALEKRCPDAWKQACTVLVELMHWKLDGDTTSTVTVPEFTNRESESIELSGTSPPEELILIPKDKVKSTYDSLRHDIKSIILEAKLHVKDKLNLPLWVYLVFIALGLDEVYFMASNPALLIVGIAFVYLFARARVCEVYKEHMENGPLPVATLLQSAWPVVRKVLEAEPDYGKPKTAAEKKSE